MEPECVDAQVASDGQELSSLFVENKLSVWLSDAYVMIDTQDGHRHYFDRSTGKYDGTSWPIEEDESDCCASREME